MIAAGEKIPLQQQVIEGQQALIALTKRTWELERELEAVQSKLDLRARVDVHQDGTVTLKDENPRIYYCATCYATRGILNPPSKQAASYGLWCSTCRTTLFPPGHEAGESGPW